MSNFDSCGRELMNQELESDVTEELSTRALETIEETPTNEGEDPILESNESGCQNKQSKYQIFITEELFSHPLDSRGHTEYGESSFGGIRPTPASHHEIFESTKISDRNCSENLEKKLKPKGKKLKGKKMKDLYNVVTFGESLSPISTQFSDELQNKAIEIKIESPKSADVPMTKKSLKNFDGVKRYHGSKELPTFAEITSINRTTPHNTHLKKGRDSPSNHSVPKDTIKAKNLVMPSGQCLLRLQTDAQLYKKFMTKELFTTEAGKVAGFFMFFDCMEEILWKYTIHLRYHNPTTSGEKKEFILNLHHDALDMDYATYRQLYHIWSNACDDQQRVGVVVMDEEMEQILVVEDYKGRFGFIKGRVNFGETIEKGRDRELKEESGIDAKEGSFLRDTVDVDDSQSKLVLFFLRGIKTDRLCQAKYPGEIYDWH